LKDPKYLVSALLPLRTRSGIRPTEVDSAIDDAKRPRLVESGWKPCDLPARAKSLRDLLDQHLVRMDAKRFNGITVYRYDNPRAR